MLMGNIKSKYYFQTILVKTRINGTKNIAKITKSMKMVSAAKLRGDQQRLNAADPFSVSLNPFRIFVSLSNFLVIFSVKI
jgi:hypothetical protein